MFHEKVTYLYSMMMMIVLILLNFFDFEKQEKGFMRHSRSHPGFVVASFDKNGRSILYHDVSVSDIFLKSRVSCIILLLYFQTFLYFSLNDTIIDNRKSL